MSGQFMDKQFYVLVRTTIQWQHPRGRWSLVHTIGDGPRVDVVRSDPSSSDRPLCESARRLGYCPICCCLSVSLPGPIDCLEKEEIYNHYNYIIYYIHCWKTKYW